MLFNTLTFLVFFVIVYSLFWLIPSWAGKKRLLLMASYLFYAAWSPPYIFLLLFSTSWDWWLARLIGRSESPTRRRSLLLLSLASNLGLLGYFKYGEFMLANFSELMASMGLAYHMPGPSIILPIGISFYTFASISYTFDVYRKEIRSDWRFTDYALFVSFFPHLVAGPIIRASRLLPQLVTPQRPTQNQVGWGLALLLMGLFSKVVLADKTFAPVVDEFYASPATFGTIDALVALLSFSGQIYYDFSGYSLCAIGLAMCFGIGFPDNFRHPYAAVGFSDFWRRWHISLSTWLRDYLYIPLGGNRLGELRTYNSLLITMLIGGLWHGASWMFVLWGGLHGLYLALERMLRKTSPALFLPSQGKSMLIGSVTFVVVTLTWIPFRAATPANAAAVVVALFRVTPLPIFDLQHMVAVIAILLTIRWHIALKDTTLENVFTLLGPMAQTGVISMCAIGLFLFSGGDQRAFIYFQF